MEWRAAVRRWKGSQEIGLIVLVLLCTACAFRGIPPAAPKAGDAIANFLVIQDTLLLAFELLP